MTSGTQSRPRTLKIENPRFRRISRDPVSVGGAAGGRPARRGGPPRLPDSCPVRKGAVSATSESAPATSRTPCSTIASNLPPASTLAYVSCSNLQLTHQTRSTKELALRAWTPQVSRAAIISNQQHIRDRDLILTSKPCARSPYRHFPNAILDRNAQYACEGYRRRGPRVIMSRILRLGVVTFPTPASERAQSARGRGALTRFRTGGRLSDRAAAARARRDHERTSEGYPDAPYWLVNKPCSQLIAALQGPVNHTGPILSPQFLEQRQNVCRNPHRACLPQLGFGTVSHSSPSVGWRNFEDRSVRQPHGGAFWFWATTWNTTACGAAPQPAAGRPPAWRSVFRVWIPSDRTGAICGR